MSYAVRQRTQEFGIRTALGAGRGDIVRMVLRRGLTLTMAGVALGVVGALALARVLSAFLYEVNAFDPVVFGSVTAALAGIALVACYLPARWAARVDPVVALRWE